eukprot:2784321-Rhodomonas_salina.3
MSSTDIGDTAPRYTVRVSDMLLCTSCAMSGTDIAYRARGQVICWGLGSVEGEGGQARAQVAAYAYAAARAVLA